MADSESGIDRKLKNSGVATIAAPDSTTRKPVSQNSRESFRSYRTTVAYEAIVDHCCDAWNRLIDQPWRIMSIGLRDWVNGC